MHCVHESQVLKAREGVTDENDVLLSSDAPDFASLRIVEEHTATQGRMLASLRYSPRHIVSFCIRIRKCLVEFPFHIAKFVLREDKAIAN